MSFEQAMGYEAYRFKFDGISDLVVKSKEEIGKINRLLEEQSPESDYESYSWYLTDEKAEALHRKKVKVLSQISWHGGLPYYVVSTNTVERHNVAEFYLDIVKEEHLNDSSN